MDLEITVRLSDVQEIMGDLARAESERDELRQEVCRLGKSLEHAKQTIHNDYRQREELRRTLEIARQARRVLEGDLTTLHAELAARDQALAEAVAEVAHLRGQLADVWRRRRS
jgi:chromosome segregation ATPase